MTQMQPYRPPLLPCKFCSYACQWCSKSPSQLCSVNIINAQTEPAGLVANTVAVPRHQQLMHPLVRKLPHQEGDSMSLQMVPLCHSLFILEVLFCSTQMYAVQTSSSGSEIPRVSSICSLVNLVCGKGSVNNLLKKGKNRQIFTLS